MNAFRNPSPLQIYLRFYSFCGMIYSHQIRLTYS